MVKTVKINFPSDPSFRRDLWGCQHCDHIDTQSHILLFCPKYDNLRIMKNFDDDQDLVEFFQQVIDMRENDED